MKEDLPLGGAAESWKPKRYENGGKAVLDQSLTPLASVTLGRRGMSVIDVVLFEEVTHL